MNIGFWKNLYKGLVVYFTCVIKVSGGFDYTSSFIYKALLSFVSNSIFVLAFFEFHKWNLNTDLPGTC